MVKRLFLLVCLITSLSNQLLAQLSDCTFKKPFYTLHFGKGNVVDVNSSSLALYDRVSYDCPTDGHYSYVSSTSDCFRGDWHTIQEDHTPGDVEGNMLLVNSAFNDGVFLSTRVKGFKSGLTYLFGVWLMNVCRPTRKCPFPLLPNLLVKLQTPNGKTVAQFATGEIQRKDLVQWIQHKAEFTVPPGATELNLTFINMAPGGCGNDLALDDITFRECIKKEPIKTAKQPVTTPVIVKKPTIPKKETKKTEPLIKLKKPDPFVTVVNKERQESPKNKPVVIPQRIAYTPVPLVLRERTNHLHKEIITGEGEILIDLYDNGEIDGDTVSIYHNNKLIASQKRLSQKAISLRFQIDQKQPRHEIVMVANNLGSIPPNTSLMIVTANEKRYQVYITSTEQQNAKVVINLKE